MAEQPTLNGKEQMADGKAEEAKLPVPQAEAHPLRFAIVDVTDKIAELQAFVAAQECDEHLKGYIAEELGEIKSNAACLNVHVVDRADGGFDLHVSVKAVHLGGRPGSVTTGTQLTGGKQ